MKANESNSKANLAQVQAQFDQAKSSYDRSKELLKNKVISQAEYDQSFTTFKTASANYEAALQTINAGGFSVKSAEASSTQAKQNLNKTLIYSPISGIVSKLNIEKGERVLGTAQMAGTELMRISDLNNMETRVDINENDVLRISLGDTAEIEVDAYLNRKFKGVVSEIAYASKSDFSITTDQVTNFTVKIKLIKESYEDLIQPEKGHKFPFRPGMSATADIQTNKQENVIAVPIQSVTIRDPKKSVLDAKKEGDDSKKVLEEIVFIVENNKAKAVKVKTGLQDDTNIEIISGLKGDEQIIFAPFKAISKTLKDGDEVIIKKEEDLYKSEN
jgi:HlyD family secretion protein